MSTPPDSFEQPIRNDQPAEGDEKLSEELQKEAEQGLPDEQLSPETPGEEQSPSQETTLPPEAQGETNGGPLGCCLGTVAGIFLTVLLTTGLPLLLFHYALPGGFAAPLAVAGALLCGFLGWKIGKHIYREYELSPVQQKKLEEWEKRRMEQLARKRKR